MKVDFSLLWLAAVSVSSAAPVRFTANLQQAGMTSAGVYDTGGRLVQVLWTMRDTPAGLLQGEWNGLNMLGQKASAGAYRWRVIVNGSVSANYGSIGNTGQPPTTSGHVPLFIEGVAVDAQDNIYTVHDWDEAHYSVTRRAPDTGFTTFNTGNAVGSQLLRAIAVEPDGSRAFVSGYADAGDRTKSRFSIWQIALSRIGTAKSKTVPFTSAGPSINVYSGGAEYPATATEADRSIMKIPVSSLALQGNTLFAADSLKGRVLLYDKITGGLKSSFKCPLARAVAVGPDGRIWVGHDHTKISVYSAAGAFLATPVTDLSEVQALAVRGGTLHAADNASCTIRSYTISGNSLTLTGSFGAKAQPGGHAPDRFFSLRGLAADSQGNLIVSSGQPRGTGSRLIKYTPALQPLWEHMGLEFSGQGIYGQTDPDLFISMHHHAYRLDREAATWRYLGYGGTENEYFSKLIPGSHNGVPRIVRMGGRDLCFFPYGDGAVIYRIAPNAAGGVTLHPVSALAGGSPMPDGSNPGSIGKPEHQYTWFWHDEAGDGVIEQDEITVCTRPGEKRTWTRGAVNVDDRGWLWLISHERYFASERPREGPAVYALPPSGTDARGNPVYDWRRVLKVIDGEQAKTALGITGAETFQFKYASRGEDGMIYTMGHTNKAGTPQNSALHQGGNVLLGFQEQDPGNPVPAVTVKWALVLPKKSVGLDRIPGGAGGVVAGTDPGNGGLSHYTREGLLAGVLQVSPLLGVKPLDVPSGLLDTYGAVACSRDPRSGVIDVFTEDNYNQRLICHRLNDRDSYVLEGQIFK